MAAAGQGQGIAAVAGTEVEHGPLGWLRCGTRQVQHPGIGVQTKGMAAVVAHPAVVGGGQFGRFRLNGHTDHPLNHGLVADHHPGAG